MASRSDRATMINLRLVAYPAGTAMSLFEKMETDNLRRVQPLAARMRPTKLADFAGQQHFLGEGKLLRRLLAADRLGSVIFYGPPGTGKTTLARLLATESQSHFRQLSAVTSGVKDLREVLTEARDELAAGGRKTLLFIDEIHRFNKSQQDALLPDVEDGIVTLVGATVLLGEAWGLRDLAFALLVVASVSLNRRTTIARRS